MRPFDCNSVQDAEFVSFQYFSLFWGTPKPVNALSGFGWRDYVLFNLVFRKLELCVYTDLYRTPSHRHCMETVLTAASCDKIWHDSSFDRSCAIILHVEITNKLFLVAFFSIHKKLSNNTAMQWRIMPSSSLQSFGRWQFSFPGVF